MGPSLAKTLPPNLILRGLDLALLLARAVDPAAVWRTHPVGWLSLSLSLPLPLVRLVFGGVVATLTGGYHFQHTCRDVHVPEMPMESDAKILGPWNLKILYPKSVQESKRTGSAGKWSSLKLAASLALKLGRSPHKERILFFQPSFMLNSGGVITTHHPSNMVTR